MPNLLSLPRELRDDIYDWLHRSSLRMKDSRHHRIRISNRGHPTRLPYGKLGSDKTVLDSTYYTGEEAIRYPSAQPIPPVDPLLRTSRQLRAETQESIQRNPVHYKIRLAYRDDRSLLYPTWISMPAFTNRIDVLDVEIRIRQKKTASLFSTNSSASSIVDQSGTSTSGGDVLFGGLVLLQRLLERGPSFLGKPKDVNGHSSLTIGIVTVHIVPKDLLYTMPPKDVFADTEEWVDALLLDKDETLSDDDEWTRLDSMMRLFASRVDLFAIQIEDMRREWLMKKVMLERDEKIQQRREEATRTSETT